MLGFKFPQSLLLRKTFLVERLTHPARGFGQRIFYFRSSHHYPNGFRQVAAGAARIGILTSEGEIQRIGPEQPSSYIIQFNLRSEEHTSELQSLMRNSYAVFCLK